MTSPNFNLLAMGQNAFEQSFRTGLAFGDRARERERQGDYEGALATLATDPENKEALATVFRYDPAAGLKMAGYADERAFRRDMAEYLAPGGQPNALLGLNTRGQQALPAAPAPQGQPPVPGNALAAALAPVPPMRDGSGFGEAFAPFAPPSPQQPLNDAPMQEQGADLSFLGEPQTGRDRAFLAMVQRDPIKALKIQSEMRDAFMDRLNDEAEFYTLAVQELSTMTDEAGWQRALQRLAPLAQAMGTDLMAVVPPSYPGPDAVRQLLENALPVKERLDFFLREANYEADNERADRNTDSLIEHRDRLAGERERHNRAMEGNTRRGQDLTDRRGRRGQDLTDRRTLPVIESPEQAMGLPAGTRFRTPDGRVLAVPVNPRNRR